MFSTTQYEKHRLSRGFGATSLLILAQQRRGSVLHIYNNRALFSQTAVLVFPLKMGMLQSLKWDDRLPSNQISRHDNSSLNCYSILTRCIINSCSGSTWLPAHSSKVTAFRKISCICWNNFRSRWLNFMVVNVIAAESISIEGLEAAPHCGVSQGFWTAERCLRHPNPKEATAV